MWESLATSSLATKICLLRGCALRHTVIEPGKEKRHVIKETLKSLKPKYVMTASTTELKGYACEYCANVDLKQEATNKFPLQQRSWWQKSTMIKAHAFRHDFVSKKRSSWNCLFEEDMWSVESVYTQIDILLKETIPVHHLVILGPDFNTVLPPNNHHTKCNLYLERSLFIGVWIQEKNHPLQNPWLILGGWLLFEGVGGSIVSFLFLSSNKDIQV